MARLRFNPAEREAFTIGTRVEWRNVSHWHAAIVTGPIAERPVGTWRVPLRHEGKDTKTVRKGDVVWGSPGAVRLLPLPHDQ